METNELMVGNFVRNRRTKEIVWVFEIDGDRGVINNEPDGYCSEKNISIDDIEPIPITSEILEKNGFGYIKDDEYSTDHITHFYLGEPQFCKNMNLHIGTDNKGNFWINTRINTIYGIKYVHEFQNALRICKIEENITL